MRSMSAEQRRQLAFLLLLLGYGLVLVVSLQGLSEGARAFPIIVLVGTTLLWAVKLAATLAPASWRAVIEPRGIVPRVAAAQADRAMAAGEAGTRGGWLLWLWLLASLVAMFALGFLLGSAASVLVYMKAIARTSWRAALLAAGATTAFVYLVFAEALRVDLGPIPLAVLLQP